MKIFDRTIREWNELWLDRVDIEKTVVHLQYIWTLEKSQIANTSV